MMSDSCNDDSEMLAGEQLIQSLEKLRTRLNQSGVERTAGLKLAMGDNCQFYWKSLNIFLSKDYMDLKSIVDETSELFRKCENE